jgi:hypothetical protein
LAIPRHADTQNPLPLLRIKQVANAVAKRVETHDRQKNR